MIRKFEPSSSLFGSISAWNGHVAVVDSVEASITIFHPTGKRHTWWCTPRTPESRSVHFQNDLLAVSEIQFRRIFFLSLEARIVDEIDLQEVACRTWRNSMAISSTHMIYEYSGVCLSRNYAVIDRHTSKVKHYAGGRMSMQPRLLSDGTAFVVPNYHENTINMFCMETGFLVRSIPFRRPRDVVELSKGRFAVGHEPKNVSLVCGGGEVVETVEVPYLFSYSLAADGCDDTIYVNTSSGIFSLKFFLLFSRYAFIASCVL